MTAHGVFNGDAEIIIKVCGTPVPRWWLFFRIKSRRSIRGVLFLSHSSTHINRLATTLR